MLSSASVRFSNRIGGIPVGIIVVIVPGPA